MALLLETVWGDLVIDLDLEGSPELCKNILKLAKARFYTNTLIFSVLQNRFCQAGDPVGDGTGGASVYGLTDVENDTEKHTGGTSSGLVTVSNSTGNSNDMVGTETEKSIGIRHYRHSKRRFLRNVGRPLTKEELREKGRVVATNTHRHTPHTIGSQFLITLAEGPDRALDGYRLFQDGGTQPSTESMHLSPANQFLSLGMVTEDSCGVLDRINAAYTDPSGRPFADIRILRALVVHDPFEDIPGLDSLMCRMGVVVDASRRVIDSPSPVRPDDETVEKRLSVAEIEEDQDDESVDSHVLQLRRSIEQEEVAKKEDKSRAVVLEMLGDLPDADIKAPEDVLFICKLNPLTVDEDLELIFARFDERVKVEIIRDPDTAASLQYAFAEFTSKQAAVEAYFKMNNALVDDRRIKVDFSQSVAKLWNKYKQKLRMPLIGSTGDGGRGMLNVESRPKWQARNDSRQIGAEVPTPDQSHFQSNRRKDHVGIGDDGYRRAESRYKRNGPEIDEPVRTDSKDRRRNFDGDQGSRHSGPNSLRDSDGHSSGGRKDRKQRHREKKGRRESDDRHSRRRRREYSDDSDDARSKKRKRHRKSSKRDDDERRR